MGGNAPLDMAGTSLHRIPECSYPSDFGASRDRNSQELE